MDARTPVVMVVDDEPSVRALMADVLRMSGYDIRTARHGMDALEQCMKDGPPDLLITDIVMPPYISGVELVREMRAVRPGLPALYVSAYAADPEVADAILADGVDFLPKPLSPIVLAQKVEQILAGAGGLQRSRRGRDERGTVLLSVADGACRTWARDCLRAGGIWVLEALHEAEAEFINQWHAGPIHLLLTDPLAGGARTTWVRRLLSSRPGLQVLRVEMGREGVHLTPESEAGEMPDLWLKVRELLQQFVSSPP